MLKLLKARYCDPRSGGNGGEFAFFEHVRSDVGAGRGRTCDALAMGLWPSRGLPVHGHEVKVTRSDWLSELRQPAKADVWFPLVNCWWLVVSDEGIVGAGELPAGWGLMAPARSKLKVLVEPERREVDALPHSFVAAMLRKLSEHLNTSPEAIQEAERRGRTEGEKWAGQDLEHAQEEARKWREMVQAFERESGVSIRGWHGGDTAAEVGAALKMVLRGDDLAETARMRLERLRNDAQQLVSSLQRTLDQQDQDDLF